MDLKATLDFSLLVSFIFLNAPRNNNKWDNNTINLKLHWNLPTPEGENNSSLYIDLVLCESGSLSPHLLANRSNMPKKNAVHDQL